MIYPENFEEKTGFLKIRNLLKNKCLSNLGRSKVDEMRFKTDFNSIQSELNKTDEFKHICIFGVDFPTNFYFDIRESLGKCLDSGTYLTIEELFELKRSLETIRSVQNFFRNDKENLYPEWQKASAEIPYFPYISDRISQVLDKQGAIRDNASPDLKNIRQKLHEKISGISKTMSRLLARSKSEGWVDSEAVLTVRDGKILIPVASSYKRKIAGFVHDESDTGKTSFIEPIEVVEINNEIRELEFAERREILKILIQLTQDILPYFDRLLPAYDFLADTDFTRAKALFSLEIAAEKPILINEPIVDFRIAKHPLLLLAAKNTEKKIIPSDIELNENQRIILISGPNAGGKSVSLKTVGMLQYMAQCGMLISANRTSRAGIFEDIFIDIGDEQSIENDLSTYSSHLMNMKYFTENAGKNSLILIDEFGTGTEPILGGAIAEAVLEELNSLKVKAVITTHYANLKHSAAGTEGMANAAMLFDTEKMMPLYRLEIGNPGSSFAFEIAEKTGLSKDLLNSAAKKISREHLDLEKLIGETQSEKRKIEINNRELENLKKELEQTIENYNKELDFTLQQRKNILKITQEQAKNILESANKTIENTVFEIKKTNAEKEKTKELRKSLEDFKENLEIQRLEEEQKINEKIEKIKQRQLNKKEKIPTTKTKPEKKEKPLSVGDAVRGKGQKTIGEIIEIKGKKILVAFGNMQMETGAEQLEKLSENEARTYQKSKNVGVKIVRNEENTTKADFMFGLDVRGKRADEALQIVSRYIDDAVVADATELKILHGTGNGILRQVIREFLLAHPLVKSVKDERIEAGGAGISIVVLEF